MKVPEIIAALDSQDDTFPRQALEEAMARSAEVTEPLLGLLGEVVRNPARALASDYNSVGHLYALYLLAQFREPRASPLVVELLSLGADDVEELLGDTLVIDMARILASVSIGELKTIHALIENARLTAKIRGIGLEALFCLVYSEELEREKAMAYAAGLLRGGLERQPSEMWTEVVRLSALLGPEEVYDDIVKAHEEGLLLGDKVDFLMEEVDDSRVFGLEMGAPRITDTAMHSLVDNTVEELEVYPIFNPH